MHVIKKTALAIVGVALVTSAATAFAANENAASNVRPEREVSPVAASQFDLGGEKFVGELDTAGLGAQPTKGFGHLDTSRAYIATSRGEHRLVALPSTGGSMCFISQRSERSQGGACGDQPHASGLITLHVSGTAAMPGAEVVLEGLVANDVTAVTVTADGAEVNVPVRHGAFIWTASAGTDATGLSLTRRGKSAAVAPQLFKPADTHVVEVP